jgi:peptidoglycan/xylan/chitin deacetylase (PgdA/CDA1 family)
VTAARRALSAALALAAVLVAPAGASAPIRRPVPILMYHVIARPLRGAPYPALYVPRRELAAQVRWLARRAYRAVTLRRVFDAWQGRAALPRKPIVLSFDDGYRSQYTSALPVLRARGWAGVLNLEVADTTKTWGTRPWMVARMIRAGWEVDAHTLTHPDLTTLDDASLRREVAGSRAAIRKRYGVPVEFFCYPSGRYDARVIAAVRAAGFRGATTTIEGLAQPREPYTLRRIRVAGGDGARGLAAKLAAAGAR